MAEHRCPACGAGAPRGAGYCPACGTALDAPNLRFESMAGPGMATEHEVALGARPFAPKRSALLVGVVAALVIGAGLAVGAGGNDGDDEQSRPPVTTPAPPTSAAAPTTRTTVRRTTTTSTVPTFTAVPIPELAGYRLYVIVDDRVVRIDPGTGATTVLGEGTRRAQDWSWLVPRAGGVVLVSDSAVFLPDDGSHPVPLGSARGEIWPAADDALAWVPSFDRSGTNFVQLVEVATGDQVGGVSVPPYAYPVGDSGSGTLLVQTDAGGIYDIAADGTASRLSDGSYRAGSALHLLQFRCDVHLACGYEVLDSAAGAIVPITIEWPDPYPVLAISPTGSHVAALGVGPGQPIGLIEVATGVTKEYADSGILPGGSSPLSWSDDGQHLVWATGVDLRVWDVAAPEPIRYDIRDSRTRTGRISAAVIGR